MDQKPVETVATPLTVASTVDAQGNVVVWDNGPQAPVAAGPNDPKNPVWAQYNTDLAAWKAAGGLPVATVLPAADANQRITGDPNRYTLEPDGVDTGAVAAKVKEIQDKREAKKKADIARADAIQLALDRREAITAVMAEHAAAAEAKKVEEATARHKSGTPPKFGSQLTEADRVAREKSEAARIAREKADHPASGTPHPKG